ncbi:hypothetical protein NA57DRAFT_50937 [Rhizodiscina lignyota]|uniref:Uncharacterized protein n=1 Tax=Rhizodiscina lignyota TaxID=1504668 RepID=A0A9P4IM66_9PEZI|nr:hypothetical protein NA57DRAFT_50937 [Rhizodiscina lignyota]
MANYSVLNFPFCFRGSSYVAGCIPPPSSFNPYNVSNITDFKIEMLQEIVSNPAFGIGFGICDYAGDILPKTFQEINDAWADPWHLNVGSLSLQALTNRTFPYPLNESTKDQAVGWWWNGVNNSFAGVQDFISAVEDDCRELICHTSRSSIGDPDISGIGMLWATLELIVLALLSAFPAILYWCSRRKTENKPQTSESSTEKNADHNVDRGDNEGPIVAILDDLFPAVIVFTFSVLLAAVVLRFQNELTLIFDLLMAEILSLISSTAMVMIASSWAISFWAEGRLRFFTTVGFVVNSLLTITLFAADFWYQDSSSALALTGWPIERRCLYQIIGDNDPNNLGGKRTSLPACFALWCAALLVCLLRLFLMRQKKIVGDERKEKRHLATVYALGLIQIALTLAVLIWLQVLFWVTWTQMRKSFGKVFINTEESWGFGQFLALATWLPSILQLFEEAWSKYSGKCRRRDVSGSTKSMRTSRLPAPWTAIRSGDKEDYKPQQRYQQSKANGGEHGG